MTDRREFATREAAAFTDRVLGEVHAVLAAHSLRVVEHAIDLHARLDAAEGLVAELIGCKRGPPRTAVNPERVALRSVSVPHDLLERCEALVAKSKARSQ